MCVASAEVLFFGCDPWCTTFTVHVIDTRCGKSSPHLWGKNINFKEFSRLFTRTCCNELIWVYFFLINAKLMIWSMKNKWTSEVLHGGIVYTHTVWKRYSTASPHLGMRGWSSHWRPPPRSLEHAMGDFNCGVGGRCWCSHNTNTGLNTTFEITLVLRLTSKIMTYFR